MRQKFEKIVSGLGGLIWLYKHRRRAVKDSMHAWMSTFMNLFFKSHFTNNNGNALFIETNRAFSALYVYVCRQFKCLFICLAHFKGALPIIAMTL